MPAEVDLRGGSSPRAWGTRPRGRRARGQRRFIPTCVGNTLCRAANASLLTVHPHVRGEHSGIEAGEGWACGSSPRAWGTRGIDASVLRPYRFIPTCVGNTCATSTRWRAMSVHPHVRGEHAVIMMPAAIVDGSSPRAWGTLLDARCVHAYRRFIPTCVGNTAS